MRPAAESSDIRSENSMDRRTPAVPTPTTTRVGRARSTAPRLAVWRRRWLRLRARTKVDGMTAGTSK